MITRRRWRGIARLDFAPRSVQVSRSRLSYDDRGFLQRHHFSDARIRASLVRWPWYPQR